MAEFKTVSDSALDLWGLYAEFHETMSGRYPANLCSKPSVPANTMALIELADRHARY